MGVDIRWKKDSVTIEGGRESLYDVNTLDIKKELNVMLNSLCFEIASGVVKTSSDLEERIENIKDEFDKYDYAFTKELLEANDFEEELF